MYTVDEIEDDQGILLMLFDIRHGQLFTVNDLWKCQSARGEGKMISKNLCDRQNVGCWTGQIIGCQKISISMQSRAQKKISRS